MQTKSEGGDQLLDIVFNVASYGLILPAVLALVNGEFGKRQAGTTVLFLACVIVFKLIFPENAARSPAWALFYLLLLFVSVTTCIIAYIH